MVIELSEKARKSLNDYIDQIKRSLKGVKYIDADEIVQNVNEHIENELGDTTEPISLEKFINSFKIISSVYCKGCVHCKGCWLAFTKLNQNSRP